MKVTLTLTEPKKHSVRYDTPNEEAPIHTVYIQKSALKQPWPQEVTITLEFPK